MGRIKKLICATSFGLSLSSPLQAQSGLHQIFAACVGRYSAEREHAWLVGDQTAGYFETQRSAFLALLDASSNSTSPHIALSHRIEVKVAHASLLTIATFGRNKSQAKHAKRLAEQHLNTCQTMLLDS